jgi:hypothetical protein
VERHPQASAREGETRLGSGRWRSLAQGDVGSDFRRRTLAVARQVVDDGQLCHDAASYFARQASPDLTPPRRAVSDKQVVALAPSPYRLWRTQRRASRIDEAPTAALRFPAPLSHALDSVPPASLTDQDVSL